MVLVYCRENERLNVDSSICIVEGHVQMGSSYLTDVKRYRLVDRVSVALQM